MWAYGAVYAVHVWTQSTFNKGHRLIRLQVVAGLVREGDGAVGEEAHRHPDDCQLIDRTEIPNFPSNYIKRFKYYSRSESLVHFRRFLYGFRNFKFEESSRYLILVRMKEGLGPSEGWRRVRGCSLSVLLGTLRGSEGRCTDPSRAACGGPLLAQR